jgi:hypothetical protein
LFLLLSGSGYLKGQRTGTGRFASERGPRKIAALGQVVSVLPLDEQFYRDDHLFVHLCHQVGMLDGEAITLTRME